MLADVDPALAGAGRSGAAAGRGALGDQGGHRRRVRAWTGAAQGAALPRRPAHDAGPARGAAGPGGTRPPRPGPAPAPTTPPSRSGGSRTVSSREAHGKLQRGCHVGAEPLGDARRFHDFGAEVAVRLASRRHFPGATIRAGGRRRPFARESAAHRGPSSNFGAEAFRPGRTSAPHTGRDSRGRGPSTRKPSAQPEGDLTSAPKVGAQGHSSGAQARGLAARRRTLPLRRTCARAPLCVTSSAAGRSCVPVCPGRRRGAGQSETTVHRPSPRSSCGADFTARAARVST